MCRLRSLVWLLVGASLLTCLYSLRWFQVTDQLDARTHQASLPPAVSAAPTANHDDEMARRGRVVERACGRDPEPPRVSRGSLSDPTSQLDYERRVEELVENPSMLGNLIVDDKNQVLYCYVPKVACTNWKRMMLLMSGATNHTDPMRIPADSVHRTKVFTKLSDLKPEAIRHRLHTYTKFLFVRHPIERVLSAFRNKFEKNYTSSAYFKKRFGVKIIKKYRTGINPDKVPATGDGVKFSEFVSYLIDTKSDKLNEHWAPVSNMCHPCSVRYEVVGKYESLAEDSEYILRRVGADPRLHFPPVVPSKTTAFVGPYFDTLTPSQQRDLIKIYNNDFRIFGYHFRDLI